MYVLTNNIGGLHGDEILNSERIIPIYNPPLGVLLHDICDFRAELVLGRLHPAGLPIYLVKRDERDIQKRGEPPTEGGL